MPSERIQRQVERLLDDAEQALGDSNWANVAAKARAVLAIDPDNEDALAFLKMAEANATPGANSQPSPAPLQPPPGGALPQSFASGRYRVARLLGEGAKKRVYLCHDQRLGRDVAFALVRTEGLDATGRQRVLREAQNMGRLGSHPNLVAVYDVGEEGESPCIVQEYMPGGDLTPNPSPSADGEGSKQSGLGGEGVAATLRVAIDICRGLAFMHQRGLVHRDLKPANVFLAADGTAKVGDFGLARADDLSRLTQHGTLVGTVAYMAPEQALGGEVTGRSDLYALGAMLYELVTGRLPFTGDATAIISQHLNTPPVAPSWHTEHCPPTLEALILRLLEKDPTKRPASASEVAEELARINPGEKSTRHTGENPLARLARGVFVGREKELERLKSAFDDAFSGRGSLVMLVGEPGIGKTRTAQELETYARMRGAQVLWGRSHESSGAPPYWPWVQVGRQWGAANDLGSIQTDLIQTEGELVRLFPELRGRPGIVEPREVVDPQGAQFRLFDAYATFLRALCSTKEKEPRPSGSGQGGPVVLVLDDLHWSDKPTLQLLQHVARDLAHLRILVVCTYRDTDLSRTHPLSEALAGLNRDPGFQRVVLRGLTKEEVGAYINATAPEPVRPDVVERIYDETEGNPFFLSEVVNLLTQEGTLGKESVSDIRIPDGVKEALGRRLDRLSAEANELLQVAAIVGREFTYDTLSLLQVVAASPGRVASDAGPAQEETLLRILEEGIEARVIEESGQAGRYRFTHALMQETLLSELSTTRRVRLHGQVGEALERRWGDRAEEHAARLALHFGEAAALSPSVQDKAAHYATVAGRQSLSQAAFADAARHFQVALSALGSEVMDARRAGILTGLGEAQRGALQVGPAWQNLVGALDFYVAARDAPNVATVASLLGTAEFFRPDLAHQLGRALAVVDPDTVDGAIVLTNFAYAMGFEGNLEESLAAFDQAERVLRSAAAASELVAHLMKRTSVRAFALEYDMNRLHELSELATSLGRQREAQEAYFYIGSIHLWRGDLDSAAQAFDRLSELAERMGIAFVLANATLLTAGVQVLRGEFETALHTLARRSNRAPVDGRLVWLRSHIEIELSLTRAMETVGDVVQWVVDLGRHGGGPGIVIVEACRAALYGQGSSYLTTARTMAQQEIGAAMTPMDRMWLAMGLALLACHDHDAAMAAAAREWLAPHRGLMAGNWTYHNDHLTGLLSLEFGDVEAAIADFESALAFQSRGYVVPYARTAHDCARALLRRRRPGDVERARSLLDEAIAISRRCGMKPLLNLCLALKLESQGIAPGDTLTSIAALSAAVDRERPSLAADADPTGAVTLMFTDIEGSTALTQQLGDAAWVALLRTHNAIVEEQVRAHGGRVVKNRGDGYMAAFPNPNAAIEAALAIQEKLKNWGLGTGDWVKPSIGGARGDAGHSPQSTVPSTPVRVRIGVHSGNPVRDGDDFFGTDVNLAARIADRALGGEVLISERVHTAVPGRAVDEPVEVELKGLSGLQRLYRVRAGGS